MIFRRPSPYSLPSPLSVVAKARDLRRRSAPAVDGIDLPGVRWAEVWTPLEPTGYVRVGRRLLPVDWCGRGVAPEIGDTVDLGRPAIRVLAHGASYPAATRRALAPAGGGAPANDD